MFEVFGVDESLFKTKVAFLFSEEAGLVNLAYVKRITIEANGKSRLVADLGGEKVLLKTYSSNKSARMATLIIAKRIKSGSAIIMVPEEQEVEATG